MLSGFLVDFSAVAALALGAADRQARQGEIMKALNFPAAMGHGV